MLDFRRIGCPSRFCIVFKEGEDSNIWGGTGDCTFIFREDPTVWIERIVGVVACKSSRFARFYG